MKGNFYLFNKINITDQLQIYFDILDNSKFDKFNQFMLFLEYNYTDFNITLNDIKLINYTIVSMINPEIKKDFSCLNDFLTIERDNKYDKAYYE